ALFPVLYYIIIIMSRKKILAALFLVALLPGAAREATARAGGGGIEPARSSIEQDSAAVRESVAQARKRARGRIETGETKTSEDFGAGKAEIREGREGFRHSTEGVRELLENARSESVSRERKMSEIAKAIESSRAQQQKNGSD
ncbi:MAG: hypothetical protein MJE68_21385, partial [Proteobacteria bacterium]|nr:hypothetical protein [Pseudomonadota bacterium]